jgi:hypothetical protein
MSALATSVASLYGWGFYQVPEASGLKGWQWVILALAIGSFISSSMLYQLHLRAIITLTPSTHFLPLA